MARSSLLGILENFERRGRETAFVFRRGYRTVRWPYRQVAYSAFQFAHALDRRGLRKGDRVLLWGDNCAEWVAAFLGCMLRGVVVVPMDLIAAPDFALRVCRQVDVRLCLCS